VNFEEVQIRPCLSGWERCRAMARRGQLDSSPVAGTNLKNTQENMAFL